LCRGLAFSAQRSLTQPCSCQSFFSVYLVTGLPHLPFYFLNVLSADWCLVQRAVSRLLGV
jgi:hypothetical protein